MTCRKTQKLLGAFGDGELQAAPADRVRSHLEGCPDCRAELARLRRLSSLAELRPPVPKVAADEWDRRWQVVRESLPARAPARRFVPAFSLHWLWRHPAWSGLAAALIVAALGLLVFHPGLWQSAIEEPACIVKLVETDVAGSSVMYYYDQASDLTVMSLISTRMYSGGT